MNAVRAFNVNVCDLKMCLWSKDLNSSFICTLLGIHAEVCRLFSQLIRSHHSDKCESLTRGITQKRWFDTNLRFEVTVCCSAGGKTKHKIGYFFSFYHTVVFTEQTMCPPQCFFPRRLVYLSNCFQWEHHVFKPGLTA